jgi:hypothetical protein
LRRERAGNHRGEGQKVADKALPNADDCNCFAVRSAARHVTQLYDQYLAPVGLRTTQFSILVRLKRRGKLTINALASEMVMDPALLGAISSLWNVTA